MNKELIAKELFYSGKTYAEIALMIDAKKSTVRSWATRGKWNNLGAAKNKAVYKKGRKDKYYTHVKPRFDYIKNLIHEGFTEKEISKKLGISYSTFNNYKKNKKEFLELINNTRVEYGDQIEEYLFRLANGKDFEQIINKDKDGNIIPDKKTGIEIQDKKNGSVNMTAIIKSLQRLKPNEYNPFMIIAREKLKHQKSIDKKRLEHEIKMNEEKLKLEKEKINALKNTDINTELQHERIKEYIKATSLNDEDVKELFKDEKQ
jgi:DNA-binding CsgD family transcriptional regulator